MTFRLSKFKTRHPESVVNSPNDRTTTCNIPCQQMPNLDIKVVSAGERTNWGKEKISHPQEIGRKERWENSMQRDDARVASPWLFHLLQKVAYLWSEQVLGCGFELSFIRYPSTPSLLIGVDPYLISHKVCETRLINYFRIYKLISILHLITDTFN